MICPGCQEAADKAKAGCGSADHMPLKCRDIGIPGQGCTCQHNQGVVPHGQ
jgi:hypothetical protein